MKIRKIKNEKITQVKIGKSIERNGGFKHFKADSCWLSMYFDVILKLLVDRKQQDLVAMEIVFILNTSRKQ